MNTLLIHMNWKWNDNLIKCSFLCTTDKSRLGTKGMAPNIQSPVEPEITDIIDGIKGPKREFKVEIVWRNVAIMSGLHLAALYGLYLCFGSAHWQTIAFGMSYEVYICFTRQIANERRVWCLAVFLYVISGLGITAGAHRLWSHRAYKAKWPLRVILCIFNTIAFQVSLHLHWMHVFSE